MNALLLIDIQKGLTKRKLHNFPLFVQTINQSINTFREAKDLIIFVQHNNKQLKYLTDDWKIDERIDKRDNDLTIQKFRGNAFFETDLENILREKNITEIVVCGLVSHGCVKATCLSGLQLGFQTAILRNGHTSWDKNAEMMINHVENELIEKGVEIVDFYNVEMEALKIRKLQKSEISILEKLLYEAIFIPDGVEPPPFEIIKKPEIDVFIKDFGSKKDDYCLVAEFDGLIVGGVWVRILSGDIKGFGNVDDETPEFAISVFKEYRNQGIGTKLMLEMIDYLKKKGYKQCSLAVQKANYAVQMYKNVGFEIIKERGEEYLMILNLERWKS